MTYELLDPIQQQPDTLLEPQEGFEYLIVIRDRRKKRKSSKGLKPCSLLLFHHHYHQERKR